jgi:hypothetical protein
MMKKPSLVCLRLYELIRHRGNLQQGKGCMNLAAKSHNSGAARLIGNVITMQAVPIRVPRRLLLWEDECTSKLADHSRPRVEHNQSPHIFVGNGFPEERYISSPTQAAVSAMAASPSLWDSSLSEVMRYSLNSHPLETIGTASTRGFEVINCKCAWVCTLLTLNSMQCQVLAMTLIFQHISIATYQEF